MPRKPNPYLADEENPPLTAEMLRRARRVASTTSRKTPSAF